MFDDETTAFLQSGCALIVGTVGPEGEPFVTRGWGVTVLSATEMQLQLLLDADDLEPLRHLSTGGEIALGATHVRTLRSIQLKGRASEPEPAADDDHRKVDQYCRDFYADIAETDRPDPALPPRLTPTSYVACIVDVNELFDQTPGPGAGARLETNKQ